MATLDWQAGCRDQARVDEDGSCEDKELMELAASGVGQIGCGTMRNPVLFVMAIQDIVVVPELWRFSLPKPPNPVAAYQDLKSCRRGGNPITSTVSKGALMKTLIRALWSSVAILAFALAANTIVQGQKRTTIEDRFTDINGVRLHYLITGKGDPVILLHGYAETSRMWRPLMAIERPLALSFLRRDAPQVGCRPRTNLFRALLE